MSEGGVVGEGELLEGDLLLGEDRDEAVPSSQVKDTTNLNKYQSAV